MLTTGIIKDITHNQLSIGTKKAILGQCLVLATALVLPILTHRMGLNFLVAQPMHWMVLFAGLVYGPVSGLILGVSIPLVSFFVSGMPLAFNLPLMIPELAVYGLLAGLLKQKITAFGALAVSLIAGRVVFLTGFAILGRLDISVLEFVQRTWAPGLVTVIIQIALLPVLAGLYIKWAKDR